MTRRIELASAWSGAAFCALFFVGLLLLAGFIPPHSPADSAADIARIYRDNTDAIRAGLVLCFFGTIPFLMFGAGILGQTRRIPGVSPTVTYLQLAAFASAVIIIIVPIVCWWVAAFRPETRSPETIQAFNDFGWMLFVVGFPPYVTWCFSTGLAIMSDTRADPLFPRWSGYYSFFVAFIQLPPVMLVFFHDGPFAWNGVISWWVPLVEFFSWIVVMTWLSARAVDRHRDKPPADTHETSRPELARAVPG